MTGPGTLPRELPLVGRGDDLRETIDLLARRPDAEPLTIVAGESGVGKSRLLRAAADEARRRGWTVAHGRAYAVETGMPYALLSDALLPLLQEMDGATLTVLSRGRSRDLRHLFPALGEVDEPLPGHGDPGELQSRIYWSFAGFLSRLGERAPLLIVLEDLHWADPSTLSLIHFVVRQLGEEPVRILASTNTDYRDGNEPLLRLERSLLALRRVRVHPLSPLDRDATGTLLEETFGVRGAPLTSFRDLLYGWTRGNPYFIEQILEALVRSGQLYTRDGTWLGWGSRDLVLPDTVRDAVRLRLQDLGETVGAVAETLAVVGAPASPRVLARVAGVPDGESARAVEALVRRGLAEERRRDDEVVVDFVHPLVQETLYQEIGLARRERLHRAVGEALEQAWGEARNDHADELAYHFSRTGAREGDGRALHYLVAAGRSALERHADREARAYLEAALARAAEADGAEAGPRIRHDLARARSRLGDFEGARELWQALGEEARAVGDRGAVASAERHLGLLAYWMARPKAALAHYDSALEGIADDDPLAARVDLAAGVALQELGQADGARERVARALALAERLGDPGLEARAHRALALLETWVGAADRARHHGWRAVELSREARDPHVDFWARWALAALEGLTGDIGTMERLMEEARGIARELHSPVLGLWVAELDVELAYARGDWDGALAMGERALRLAGSLNQGTLQARLRVLTALVYLGRGDLDRARDLVDATWRAVGVDGDGTRPPDLHAVIPAHIGRAALHLAEGDHAAAIAVGERGLELADGSGYVVWVLHRLLPVVGEAHLRSGDLEAARAVGDRLRREGERMGHRFGLAWADACDAIVAWHSGRIDEGARLLRAAAETLEAFPMLPEAARLRRQLAGRLADLGDRDGALAELRRVHDVFGSLGAEPELRKTREQFRELGARPPSRSEAEGTADLTGREVEVAALVAERMSNKAIAKRLDVSPRTVTTHLSNIYRKLEIGSREELADLVREGRVAVEPARPRPE